MKTEKEILEIEKKLANNEKLEPSERSEAFYIEDGVATDRAIHGTDEWNEDDEYADKLFRQLKK